MGFGDSIADADASMDSPNPIASGGARFPQSDGRRHFSASVKPSFAIGENTRMRCSPQAGFFHTLPLSRRWSRASAHYALHAL